MYGSSTAERGQEEKDALLGHEPRHILDAGKVRLEDEMQEPSFYGSILNEGFGTTIFTLFVVLAMMTAPGDVMRIALVAGMTFLALTYMFFLVSGGHLNPAITVSVWLAGRMTLPRAAAFIVAQMVGALLGAAVARSVSHDRFNAVRGGVTDLQANVSRGQGVWVEIIGTFFLVLAYLAATDRGKIFRSPFLKELAPIEMGVVLMVVHLVLLPLTNCSVNPARSFGPAVVSGHWDHHWIFWVGPLVGGILANICYTSLFFFSDDMDDQARGRSFLGRWTGAGRRAGTSEQTSGQT